MRSLAVMSAFITLRCTPTWWFEGQGVVHRHRGAVAEHGQRPVPRPLPCGVSMEGAHCGRLLTLSSQLRPGGREAPPSAYSDMSDFYQQVPRRCSKLAPCCRAVLLREHSPTLRANAAADAGAHRFPEPGAQPPSSQAPAPVGQALSCGNRCVTQVTQCLHTPNTRFPVTRNISSLTPCHQARANGK